MTNRERLLEELIRRFRRELHECADPKHGWERIEAADTFEESKDLVPLSEEEKRFFND